MTQPTPDPQIIIPQPSEREQVEQMGRDNDATLIRLARMGGQVQEISIVRMMVGAIIEEIFGDLEQPARLAFERRYHTNVATALADVESQIAQAKLMAGVEQAVNGAAQIILPPGGGR